MRGSARLSAAFEPGVRASKLASSFWRRWCIGVHPLPIGLSMMRRPKTVECSQENDLAFEEAGVGPPAQPGFAAGIAEKPPHPAKGAGNAGCCEIRKRRHSLEKPWFALYDLGVSQERRCHV